MDRSRAAIRQNVTDARTLRTQQTGAEARLWEALRGRRVSGLKFRRQHPIGAFVVDFCCAERRLIVELDGGVHETQRERDADRQAVLEMAGYRVLRVRNEEIFSDLGTVLAMIQATALATAPIAASLRSRTGGL